LPWPAVALVVSTVGVNLVFLAWYVTSIDLLLPHLSWIFALVFSTCVFIMQKRRKAKKGTRLSKAAIVFSVLWAVFAMSIRAELHRPPEHRVALKRIGLACHLYSQNFDGYFPDKSLSQLVPEYLSADVLRCPFREPTEEERNDPYMTISHIDYTYVAGLKWTDPPILILAYSKSHELGRTLFNWHLKGRTTEDVSYDISIPHWKKDEIRYVLYLDGHVEIFDEVDFQKKLAAQENWLKGQ